MIVTLDGHKLEADFSPDADLRSLIDFVRQRFIPDRLIVSVAVNGTHFSDDALSVRLADPIAISDQVDFQSADRLETGIAALRAVANHIGELATTAVDIADDLPTAGATQTLRSVSDFIRGWQVCNTAIAQTSTLSGVDLTLLEHDGRTVHGYLTTLIEKLTLMREALEARDFVSLADVLRYEMPDECRTWTALLSALADRLVATKPDRLTGPAAALARD